VIGFSSRPDIALRFVPALNRSRLRRDLVLRFARKKSSLDAKPSLGEFWFSSHIAISNTRLFGVRVDQTREFHLGLGDAFSGWSLRRIGGGNPRGDRARPDDVAVLDESRCAFRRDEEYDDALNALDKAVGYDPNFAPAWSQIGLVFLRKGDPDTAIRALGRALEVDPRYALAHYKHGARVSHKNDAERYAIELDRAIQSDPYYVPANLEMAFLLIEDGPDDKAREQFAKKFSPSIRTTKTALEYMRRIDGR